MARLTTNKTVEEMSMTELAHNCCYAKDGYACYRDFDTDIDARELARDLMLNYGFWKIDSDEVLSDEFFDEAMLDNLQYGSKEMEGLIALFYSNLWAMADLHSRLKAYEDAEEQGLLLRLPCKVGDTAYYVHKEYLENVDKWITTIDEVEVNSFGYNVNLFVNVSMRINGSCFGRTLIPYKTLFFTKEEAEQALAKMKEV